MELDPVGFFSDIDSKNTVSKFLGHKVFALNNLIDKSPRFVSIVEKENLAKVNKITNEINAVSIDLTGYYKT